MIPQLDEIPKSGDLIYAEAHGVGTVLELKGNPPSELLAEFADGSRRRVALNMRSLRVLDPRGFLAVSRDPAQVRRLMRDDPAKIVRALLLDNVDHRLTTDEIRSTLEPRWIAHDDWKQWWQSTRETLKRHPELDTSRAKQQIYALRSEERQREDELIGQLGYGRISPVERLGYLRQLIELDQSSMLTDQTRRLLNDELRFLVSTQERDSSVRVQALLLMAVCSMIDTQELERELRRSCGSVIRWRPVTNTQQFQLAHEILLGCSEPGQALPAATWSGLLALPRLAQWLLRTLEKRESPERLTDALIEALRAAFPPHAPLNGEVDWAADLISVVDRASAVPRAFAFWSKVNWEQLAQTLVACVLSVTPADLQLKGMGESAIGLVLTAARWYPATDSNDRALWLVNQFLGTGTAPYLVPIVVEGLLRSEDGEFQKLATEHLAKAASSSWITALLGSVLSRPAIELDRTDTLASVEYIAESLGDRLSEMPEVAKNIVAHIAQLAADAPEDEVPRLLRLAQLAGVTPLGGPESTRVEGILWQRLLARQAGADWKGMGNVAVRLGHPFAAALDSLLTDHATAANARIQELGQQVHGLQAELEQANQDLYDARQRAEMLTRTFGDRLKQERGEASPDQLLLGVASAVAEVERATSRQKLRPEAAAQLLNARLQKLLRDADVSPMGSLGERTRFNPQRHEIVEGILGSDREVEVIERGYLITGPDGSKVLKPSLVRATGV